MFVHSTFALDRIQKVRRIQRLAVIFAGSVFAAGSLYSYAVHSQKERAKPIVTHALTLCRAFAAECHLDGEPRFVREQVPLPSPARSMRNPLWYVPVRANGLSYAMIFRADTRRLCYVFNLSSWENRDHKYNTKATKTSANLAVNQSLLYLKRLAMVTPETEIALEGKPESLREETGWQVIWKTRSTSNPIEGNLRVVISQRNGRLLQVADTSALRQEGE